MFFGKLGRAIGMLLLFEQSRWVKLFDCRFLFGIGRVLSS